MNPSSIVQHIEKYREILISNLIMIAEIPAPLKASSRERGELIADRLSNYELLDISMDEVGNVIAIIPAKNATKTIALVAHMDTIHGEKVDHTIEIKQDSIIGAGLVDNSVGVAALTTLPYILKNMDISLNSNLICCFSANSLGINDLKSTRFFLENINRNINYGICVEGYPFGRISYQSLGSIRKKFVVTIPEEYDWTRFGQANAIVNINYLMNAILEIPIPNRPKTTIVFNEIKGGHTASITSSSASLSLEIRSESNKLVSKLNDEIAHIVRDISLTHGVDINIETITRRLRGGLESSHPMVRALANILDNLNVSHRVTPSNSDLSEFIRAKIPALTLGITSCKHYNQEKEIMYIEPIYKGMAQLLSLILSIDGDFPHV